MTMVAGWRQRKRLHLIRAMAAALLCALAGSLASASTNDQIVSDSQSGLAISGYDPVAYFTDAQPRLGLVSLEQGYRGVVWRFRNEGNRAAFVRNPEVYMPRFGGYDPVAIARGTSVPGHPLFWLLLDQRLYLFYSLEARAAFAVDPAHYLGDAERNWAEVRRKLAR